MCCSLSQKHQKSHMLNKKLIIRNWFKCAFSLVEINFDRKKVEKQSTELHLNKCEKDKGIV